MNYAVIIAGGAGKRLWPKSRKACPKFLLKINSKKTLLEETIERVRGFIPLSNILVVTNKEFVNNISKVLPNLPKKNIIGEPLSRNTAPAIAVACAYIHKANAGSTVFILPADQIIKDTPVIKEIFGLASLIASMKDAIITLGINPSFPATGYGYIKTKGLYKRLISGSKYDISKVERFIEKPDLKKAKQFLKSKRFLWNSGIFIAKAGVFLNELKRYQPRLSNTIKKIEKGLGTKRQNMYLNRYYKNFPDISIDYAVMEKTKRALVIKADIRWDDVGSWLSLIKHFSKDKQRNIITAKHIGIDTRDSIIIGEEGHLVATLGLDDIIVVSTKDATLICHKDRAEDVKKLVEMMHKKGLHRHI